MKIGWIKLKNFIGPYNGLGLNEIYIDFRKCKNKITVIRGDNGSGKSEIYKSLHMFPDENNRLIPGLEAEKNISYIDIDIVYDITIKHPIKQNGDRDTTKAYITKITPYDKTELNANGNITSYKEVIYSEFSLDPNFIALSELSSADRGLADKKPSERKRFVNPIINKLQTYNDIYKTMTKRSSIFKSIINNIITKIENIGDEENLKLTLKSIEDRLNNKINEKNIIIEEIADCKSKVKLLDPDGSIQNTYEIIYNDLVSINKEYENIINKINISLNKLNLKDNATIEEIMDNYKKISDKISTLEISIKVNESKINSLLNEKEQDAISIQKKSAKSNSLQSDIDYKELEKIIKTAEMNLNEYINIINKIGITDINNISKEEFIIGLETIQEIRETINIFKSSAEYDILEQSIQYVKNNNYPNIEKVNSIINNSIMLISELKSESDKYNLLDNISNKLSMRPSNCKIENCAFIKDSIDAFNKKPKENIEKINIELDKYNSILEDNQKLKMKYEKMIECINHLKFMLKNLDKHRSILNKLPINNLLSNKDILLDNILNGYDFNEIDELYKYLDYANIIEEYKFELDKYNNLKSKYESYKNKIDIINDIIVELDELDKKIDLIRIDLDKYNTELISDKNIISGLKSDILEYDLLIKIFNIKINLESKKQDLINKFNVIKNNIIIIKDNICNIDILHKKLDNINKEIKPLLEDRDKINHGIKLLYEYKEELKIYNLKYEKIETIKKYSSPTTGIQTLFISLYMNKTISLANELLTLLFDSKFILGEIRINESEFRIPCIGNDISNDDISSMSTAQICMISMVLSFVMLKQSSTRYNILKLDEIDGALDTINRIKFLEVLYKLIDMIEVEQCIMISHNTEMDLSNCDIIQLKLHDSDIIDSGNIIYKY